MPRAASTSTEEKIVKKAPRKRAAPKKTAAEKKATPRKTTTRKTATNKATPRKTTTRKTVAKKPEVDDITQETELPEVVAEKEMSSTRKAPTKFAQEHATKKSKRNQYIVIAFLIIIGVGSSAAVGLSDSGAGQINVTQTIKERNERMANLVDVDGPTVVAPTPSQQPDGGLIGLRPADPEPAPAPATTTATTTVATTTATSTATSTDSSLTEDEIITAEPPSEQSATDTATTTVEAVDPEL
jgi:hypothetical protein